MAALTGKWKRVKCENSDALIKELVGDDAVKAGTLKAYYETADVVDEITVTSEETQRKTYINGELKMDLSSTFGADIERKTFLGNSKLFGTLVSDSCVEIKATGLDHPSGLFVFKLVDGKMIVTQTVNGVTCTRTSERC